MTQRVLDAVYAENCTALMVAVLSAGHLFDEVCGTDGSDT